MPPLSISKATVKELFRGSAKFGRQHTIIKNKTIYYSYSIFFTTTTVTITITTIMPPLSISKATVKELFRGSAKFGRPSEEAGAGWVATSAHGNVIIQKQINQDGTSVVVVRWTNYMDLDGLNGRILPGLPILRKANSVYFKTSSTTTRGDRHKSPFVFQFETVDEAEVFEMWWFKLNGSIASWKEEDAKKKEGNSNSAIIPLKDKTNAASTPVHKRKGDPMIGGPLVKKVKGVDHSLNAIGGGDINVDENVPALCDGLANDDDDDGISDPRVVNVFDTFGSMPKEVNVYGKLRAIVKVKRYILKSIAEDLIEKNEEDGINSNNLKDSKDSDSDEDDDDGSDSSDDSSGEDLIIDELDAPQSQNWMTAFAK